MQRNMIMKRDCFWHLEQNTKLITSKGAVSKTNCEDSINYHQINQIFNKHIQELSPDEEKEIVVEIEEYV